MKKKIEVNFPLNILSYIIGKDTYGNPYNYSCWHDWYW